MLLTQNFDKQTTRVLRLIELNLFFLIELNL